MAKIYTGTYGKDTTDETALVTNLLKYPEIGKKLIQQYPRFSLTYLLEAAGRNAAEKIIGDYAFEWKMMGRYRKPAVLNASITNATYAAGATVSMVVKHQGTDSSFYGDNLNVNDVVRFKDGATALVTNVPTVVGTDNTNTITLRAIDIMTTTATNSAAGDIVGVIGSAFNQGSLASEVGQNYAYPDTYKNWLTLSRKKCKIMGSDLTDVTWIESNGHRLWYFTKEQQMTDQFMYELEAQRWYGKKSLIADSAAGYPGDTGDFTAGLPIMGDGLLAQIDGSNQATYTAGALTEEDIVNFIGTLSKNALSAEGNVWTVFTGTQGRIDFHRAMKDLLVSSGAGGASLFASKGGAPVALGANFSEYNILGNKMILSYCPIFDDPNMHNSISSSFDSSNESGKMVFVDMGMQNGVSNVELIAKGAEGFNRSFVKKYVPGMVNPYDYNSMMAANGDDFFECQILSESGIILRNPLSCGILSNA